MCSVPTTGLISNVTHLAQPYHKLGIDPYLSRFRGSRWSAIPIKCTSQISVRLVWVVRARAYANYTYCTFRRGSASPVGEPRDHQSVPKHLIPSLKSSPTSVFERVVCGRRQRPSVEHPQEPQLEGTKRGQGAHLRMTMS